MTNPERYHILDEIGRGGMGVVYRARDTQLGREVALKLLPAIFAQEENALRRFQQEAQLIAQLEHPHIVPIHDVGVRGDQPFLVMRLLRGGSLYDRLKKGQISPADLWQIVRQIGRALDTTHAQHIIHRDVKPSNILFDEYGQAYITDFGIAKALDATTQYTGNTVVGSPLYMSPEQFTGHNLSGRTDQYALAVVVYEALAGQLPFQGNTIQLMHNHLHQRPPAIHSINPDLPPAINDVLQRALAKDPPARYDTLTQFADALQQAAVAPPATTTTITPTPISPASPPKPAPLPPPPPPVASDFTTSTKQKLQLFYRQGLQALDAEQWEVAIEAFRQVLVIDPTHINAQNRLYEAQARIGGDSDMGHTRVVPTPVTRPPKAQIVKGAGGTNAISATDLRRWPLKWWMIGGGVLLIIVLLVAMMSGGTADPTPTPAPTAVTISVAEEATSPPVPPTEVAQDAPTPLPQVSPAVLDFSATVYNAPGATYLVQAVDLLEITQGDLVVEGTGTAVAIQTTLADKVFLDGNSLVGLRYDTGRKQLAVHCLRGSCRVQGAVGGDVALAAGQATVIGSSGVPSEPSGAQYELFVFAAVVPTPTATPSPTFTPTPTATFTATPRPTNTPTATATPMPNTPIPATAVPQSATAVPPTETPPPDA